MAVPAAPTAVSKAMAMLGRAAAGAGVGVARRRTLQLAGRNLRLLIVLLAMGTAFTAVLFILPILLVAMTLGVGLSSNLPVSSQYVTGLPGTPLAAGVLACPVPGSVGTQPFCPSSLAGEPALFGYAHFHAGVDLAAP